MERRRTGVITVVVACALLASAVLSFAAFERESVAIIKRNMYDALDDLAGEQNQALQAEIRGLSEVACTLAAAIPGLDGDQAQVRALLAQVKQSDQLAYVGVVDGQGNGYLSDGAPVPPYVLELKDLPAPCVRHEDWQGEELFLFAAPVAGGGAVFTCYPEARFVKLLATQAMSDSSYAFIALSDGHIIVHSDHASYVNITNNTLDFYREVVIEGGDSVERVAGNLQSGQPGMLAYAYGNQYRYAIYKPVHVNDWFLFNVVDGNQMAGQITQAHRQLTKLALRLAGVLALAVALVLLMHKRRAKRMDELAGALRTSEALRGMAEQMSYTILFEADPVTGELAYNDAFERQLGHKPQITNFHDLLGDHPLIPAQEAQAWRRLAQEMNRGVPKSQVSVQLPHSNGERIWYRVSFQTVYDQAKSAPVRIIGRFANIERQEREQDKQLAQAERDELTGLMGHMAFMGRAEKRLSRGDACALLIADIDGFKGARNIDGHYQGDQMLVRMSEAMRQVFGEGDLLGRLGGDTFAVLVAGSQSPEDVAQRAAQLCQAFEQTDGHTCSIGIAMADEGARAISELCHRADKALYRAKLAGKHRYEFYEAVQPQQNGQGRGDDANQVLKRCAIGLITCDALAVGMDDALREIAQYYRADRAFVMEADAQRNTIAETYSWCAPGHEPPMGKVMPLAQGSLIAKALAERHTLSVPEINEKTVPDREELMGLRARKVTALFMVPMAKGGFSGFLGIENPRDHVGSVTLLKQVSAVIASAIHKLKK